MIIVEKNEGRKIDWELIGTRLSFADGELMLNLARYQQDEIVMRDIMVDNEGYLTTGRGRYYAAQVEIPAREYEEEIIEPTEPDAEPEIRRTPLPLDTDKVTLYLFSIEGIIIN